MKTENGALNDCSQRQVVEKLSELFPDIGITVLAKALIIKSVSTTMNKKMSDEHDAVKISCNLRKFFTYT